MFATSHALEVGWGWLFVTGFMAAAGATVWKLLPWAIKKGLEDSIEHQVRPMIAKLNDDVNERFDAHIGNEEHSFDTITAAQEAQTIDVAAMRQQFGELHEAIAVTQEVVAKHAESDNVQFAAQTRAQEAQTSATEAIANKLIAIQQSINSNGQAITNGKKKKKKGSSS